MATINPLTGHPSAGIAGKSEDTLTPMAEAILAGDVPNLFSTWETVESGQTLEALTVVGFDANGHIVPADISDGDPANHVTAIGVLVYPIDTDTTGTNADTVAEVYRGGNFNPDRLVWHASYDDDAKKRKAFEGAPSPTQIVVTKTQQFTAPA